MAEVIVINPITPEESHKKRVCSYARVSSNSADQLNSFISQVNYYTKLIGENEEWEFVDIYADEGLTGLRTDKREEFQRMLKDCRKGKIDRILTKSISRFSRNTRDCLESIRELKALGVSVMFEKENIDTETISNEMMLTFFSNSAQEESMSISGNMRWSYRHRMKSGRFITCKAPYGYRLENGVLRINEQEAEIIRSIFTSYLNGKSILEIADEMAEKGLVTRDGKIHWHYSSISYILKNERYTGNALLQKKCSTDNLPFQKVRNKGQKDQYYLHNSHEAIIDKELFDRVQKLTADRNICITTPPNQYALSKKIFCGECGSAFKRRVCNGKTYWVCSRHNKSKEYCSIGQIPETEIYQSFIRMYNKLKQNSKKILNPLLDQLQELKNRRNLNNVRIVEINQEIAELTEQNLTLNRLKSKGFIDSDFLIEQSNDINRKIAKLRSMRHRLIESDEDDNTIRDTQNLIEIIDDGISRMTGFDEPLFECIVDRIIVESKEKLKIVLINDLQLTEKIEKASR